MIFFAVITDKIYRVLTGVHARVFVAYKVGVKVLQDPAVFYKFGNILLYDDGRQFLKLVLTQLYLQVLFDNLRISFARFRFRRRLYVIRKPYVQPIFIFHKLSFIFTIFIIIFPIENRKSPLETA